MNNLSHGSTQSIVENFIEECESNDLYSAMDNCEVCIAWISQRDDVISVLTERLGFDKVVLLWRLISEFRATGNSPKFGIRSSTL
jgi:hypothetical protein